jgi:hypothetical protein
VTAPLQVTLDKNLALDQGDQMSLWKNRQNSSPSRFLSKLIQSFIRGKSAKKLVSGCNFQKLHEEKNCVKGEISPEHEPILRHLKLQVQSQRSVYVVG